MKKAKKPKKRGTLKDVGKDLYSNWNLNLKSAGWVRKLDKKQSTHQKLAWAFREIAGQEG